MTGIEGPAIGMGARLAGKAVQEFFETSEFERLCGRLSDRFSDQVPYTAADFALWARDEAFAAVLGQYSAPPHAFDKEAFVSAITPLVGDLDPDTPAEAFAAQIAEAIREELRMAKSGDALVRFEGDRLAGALGEGLSGEGAFDGGVIAAYLQAVLQRLDVDHWPADTRLDGPYLGIDKHSIDIPALDAKSDELVSADGVERFHRLIVLGGPGTGKTWFAKRAAIVNARQALSALKQGTDPRLVQLPLFATVASVGDQPSLPARQRLVSAALGFLGDVGESCSMQRVSATLVGHERVMVFLDSLDEAAGSAHLLSMLDGLRWQVVLTSRPSAWHGQLLVDKSKSDQAVLSLAPLKYPADVRRFVQAWFGSTFAEAGEPLLLRLAESQPLQDSAQVPLLLAFFCVLGHDNLTDDIDVTFDRIVNRLLHGVWRTGRRADSLPLDRLKAVLRGWAWEFTGFDATSRGVSQWSGEMPVDIARDDSFTQDEVASLAHVCPPVGPPDLDLPRRRRQFVHRAIQEHLVAAEIASREPDEAATMLRANLWATEDWREVIPAAIRMHPRRVELCHALLESEPFAGIEPDRIPQVDLDGSLDRILLALARSADPEEVPVVLRAHVCRARLRSLDSPETLEDTTAWGIGNADLQDLAEKLVPRTGGTIPSKSVLPLHCLGLTEQQRKELRGLFIDRIDEDDGSFGRVLTVLVDCSTDGSDQNDLLARITAAFKVSRGWRRDELATAYRSISQASDDALWRLIASAVGADIAAGVEVSWTLIDILASSSWRAANPADANGQLTAWITGRSASPYSQALIARTALEWPLSAQQRSEVIEALLSALRLSASQEWLDDDEHHFVEERFVAMDICRLLTSGARTAEQAKKIVGELSQVLANSTDLRTVSAAADALPALAERFPSESAVGVDALRERFLTSRFASSLFRPLLAVSDELSADDAWIGLLSSSRDGFGSSIRTLGSRSTEFWAEVVAHCSHEIEKIESLQVEDLWRVERALDVAGAVVAAGQSAPSIVSSCSRLLDRLSDQPINQFQFGRICRHLLFLAVEDDGADSRVYRAISDRISNEVDVSVKRGWLRILTEQCRREQAVPNAMLPVLEQLKSIGGDDWRLVCSRYEFLTESTATDWAEFLRLLSTYNQFMDSGAVRDISTLAWSEQVQESLWTCLLGRLTSDETPMWHRISIAKILTAWARTESQQAQIGRHLVTLLTSLASDASSLGDGRGITGLTVPSIVERPELELANAPDGNEPRQPESGLVTELGMYVRFLAKQSLPDELLTESHNLLVERAAQAEALEHRAAYLECAGALLPDDEALKQGRERALALIQEADGPGQSRRGQRALRQFRPSANDLMGVETWLAPPSPELLRIARQESTLTDWIELLERLGDLELPMHE